MYLFLDRSCSEPLPRFLPENCQGKAVKKSQWKLIQFEEDPNNKNRMKNNFLLQVRHSGWPLKRLLTCRPLPLLMMPKLFLQLLHYILLIYTLLLDAS